MRETRWTAMVLLAFLGISGIAGGVPMIADPSGTRLRMDPSLLRYSPFHSFLIPGILLLAANGLLAIWVFWLAAKRRRNYGWWTAFQGWVLLVWLVVECIMLRLVVWPHYLYGGVAVALIAAGVMLRNAGNERPGDGRTEGSTA